MHTVSETGHTGDLLAATHLVAETLLSMDAADIKSDDLRMGHPRLDMAEPLTWRPAPESDDA